MPRASATELLEASRNAAYAQSIISGTQTIPDYIKEVSPEYSLPDWVERVLIPVFEAARHEPQRVCISAPPRHGKKIANSTPVLTVEGWSTHGQLKLGTRVFGPDGKPTAVTYLSSQSLCDMRVSFSDGSSVIAHSGHLWGVYNLATDCGYSVMSTEEILISGVNIGHHDSHGKPDLRFSLPLVREIVGFGLLPYPYLTQRRITSIEKCEPELGQCITVDNESHLYLVGETLIPTHNTYPLLHAIAKWTRDFPCDTNAYASFNVKKGRSKSKIIRKFAKKSGVELDPAMQNLDEWRTIQGGGLLAGSLSGNGLTGDGIQGIMCVDDPFPDMKSAESAQNRQDVWDGFNAVVMTRLEGASVIVVQTRWHSDDLVGKLEKLGGWNIINIPAIAEEGDYLGREAGEALDPIKYPLELKDSDYGLEALAPKEKQLGPYVWSSLYQGQPRSKGLKVFGAPYYYNPETFDIKGMRVVIGADPAASEKTSADHSAAVVMAMEGVGDDAVFHILDVWRGQVQIPDFVNVLYALQKKYYGAHVIIEAASGFKGVAQSLQRLDRRLKVFEIAPRENKFMRAQPFAAMWNSGKVLIPTHAKWVGDFYVELDRFTGVKDAEDDQVDAAAHAFNMFEHAATSRHGSREDV